MQNDAPTARQILALLTVVTVTFVRVVSHR
jgi:hypothetical protein